MNDRHTVVVYGTSLFSTSVETSLRNQPEFAVVQVDNLQSDAIDHLTIIRPHVVIVDVTDDFWDIAMTYFIQQPSSMLIGLDPRTSTMFMVRGQHTRLTSMQQLIATIEHHITAQ